MTIDITLSFTTYSSIENFSISAKVLLACCIIASQLSVISFAFLKRLILVTPIFYGENFSLQNSIILSKPMALTISILSILEVSIFFREKDDGYKISLRSNDYVNVSDICLMFSGGGHIRAAGGSINLPFEQAKQKVIEECKKYLK